MVLCRVFHDTAAKTLTRAAVIWRLDWSCRICFQDGSLRWKMIWYWLLAEDQFLTFWTSPQNCFYDPIKWQLSLPWVIQARAKQKLQWLFILSLRSHILLFLQYPIGHTVQLYLVWEGTARSWYQKAGIIAGHFRGWLPQLTHWHCLLPGLPHKTIWASSQHGEKVSRERKCKATTIQEVASGTMVGSVRGYVFRNWYNIISTLFCQWKQLFMSRRILNRKDIKDFCGHL